MYNYWTLVQFFFGNLLFIISIFLISKMFFQETLKDLKKVKLLLLIPLFLITSFSSYFFPSIFQVLVNYLVIFLLLKLIYKKNLNEILVIYLSTGLLYFFTYYFETLIVLLLGIDDFKNTYLEISSIAIITYLLAICIRKIVNKVIYKIEIKANISLVILTIITIISFLISTYNLISISLNIKSLVINIILPLFFLSLTFLLIKQEHEHNKLLKKYQLLEEYIETSSDLIEKYSATIHKYKNTLITIKGYVKTDKENALEYIDSLLDDYKPKKKNWLLNLNYIKEDSIRYLTYYKLAKAEDCKLKVSAQVSNNIKKVDYSFLDIHEISTLLEILGEYFDNAIYASLDSKEHELDFTMYLDDNDLIFLIANTYKDEIDLNLIEENGYTTKGKGHGLGLYEVAKSIKNRKRLSCSYEILDNYFMAKLIVKLSDDSR